MQKEQGDSEKEMLVGRIKASIYLLGKGVDTED